jgi:peptide/nickel transport system permease protein
MAVISISKSSLLLMDFLSMIPRILLIFCVLALVPQGWLAVVVLLGCTGWVGIARLVRAEVLRLNEEGYVEAAKAMGAPPLHILRKHIAPFVWPVVRSALSLAFAATVLSEAALSFLDMGLPPETFTWGRMMLMGKMNLQAWWLFVIPVLCIFAVTASLHRLADYWSQYSRHSTSIRELVS